MSVRQIFATHPVCALIALFPAAAAAAPSDADFGLTIRPSVEKKFDHGLSLKVEGELRTRDESHALERLAASAYVGYKPFGALKLEAGYKYAAQFKPASTQSGAAADALPASPLIAVGSYWAPRHSFDAAVYGYLTLGPLELSLRERYRFTRHESATAEFRVVGSSATSRETAKSAKSEHVMRSRLQIAAKLPGALFLPYGSFELFNDLADGGAPQNFRVILGADVAVTDAQKLGAFFRADLFYDVAPTYLLGLKYAFAF